MPVCISTKIPHAIDRLRHEIKLSLVSFVFDSLAEYPIYAGCYISNSALR
jgi:hypothetical protein